MRRIKVDAEVVKVTPSEVMEGVYYVTAQADYFGEVKYRSNREPKIGEKVVLQDQKLRNMTDIIRWEEVKK